MLNKGDAHLNSSCMTTWNAASGFVCKLNPKTKTQDYYFQGYGLGALLIRNGITCFSPSDCVSILKESARMLCEN